MSERVPWFAAPVRTSATGATGAACTQNDAIRIAWQSPPSVQRIAVSTILLIAAIALTQMRPQWFWWPISEAWWWWVVVVLEGSSVLLGTFIVIGDAIFPEAANSHPQPASRPDQGEETQAREGAGS